MKKYILQVSCLILSWQAVAVNVLTVKKRSNNAARCIVKETYQVGKIVVGSIMAAVTYGIINDMVTARICPEYFTEGFHRRMLMRSSVSDKDLAVLLNPKNVNQIALWWGPRATWWFGGALSIPIVAAARIGSWPKLGMEDIAKPLSQCLGGLFLGGMGFAGLGYLTAKSNPYYRDAVIRLGRAPLTLSEETKRCYVADACAHELGYAGGAAIAIGLIPYILWKRYKKSLSSAECQQ